MASVRKSKNVVFAEDHTQHPAARIPMTVKQALAFSEAVERAAYSMDDVTIEVGADGHQTTEIIAMGE